MLMVSKSRLVIIVLVVVIHPLLAVASLVARVSWLGTSRARHANETLDDDVVDVEIADGGAGVEIVVEAEVRILVLFQILVLVQFQVRLLSPIAVQLGFSPVQLGFCPPHA